MEILLLDPRTVELVREMANADWTLNMIVGWILIGGALFFGLFMRLFANTLLLQWLGKEVLGDGKKESSRVKLRKYFLPLFTKDPNDEFRPYIHYWTPVALGMAATLVAGMFIAATDSLLTILLGFLLLGGAYFGCVKLLRWQIRNNRW